MKVSTKLTSIKLLEDLYLQFKINTVGSKMSLQRLVNRSMYLYTIDNSFMKNIGIIVNVARIKGKINIVFINEVFPKKELILWDIAPIIEWRSFDTFFPFGETI